MQSPFPGMDPFIEARGLWNDFHGNLVVEIQRALNAGLPQRYEALIDERTFVDLVDPDEGRTEQNLIRPDVRVDRATDFEGVFERTFDSVGDVATSVIMHPRLAAPEREPFVEIYDAKSDNQVVTCIELLSPTNKRPGSAGWAEYERKRQLMLAGVANFVEIDLLRGGVRRAMRESWPRSPYYILVTRKASAPECRVWPGFTTRPLPPVTVPLAPPDADFRLDLQSAIHRVLEGSRYERRLKYQEPIEPALAVEEQQIVAEFLKRSVGQ
jgi:hypothetical protein